MFFTNALRWRHYGRDSVSNHQPRDCLLNLLFRCRSKKTSKLRVTGLCAGNSPGTGEFPAQVAGNAENVSIWWRHHVGVEWQETVASHSLRYLQGEEELDYGLCGLEARIKIRLCLQRKHTMKYFHYIPLRVSPLAEEILSHSQASDIVHRHMKIPFVLLSRCTDTLTTTFGLRAINAISDTTRRCSSMISWDISALDQYLCQYM